MRVVPIISVLQTSIRNVLYATPADGHDDS